MASPDHQIPVSADLEAKDKKQAESRKESDNTTSNQQTKEGQATEVVFDLSCAPSTKDTFCPQGDQDISQSQAHVPQAEKASEPNEAKPNERDISRGKWMSNQVTEASQPSKSVLSPLCPQGVEDTSQSKAQVPLAEIKPDADSSGTKRANLILISKSQAQVHATGSKSAPYEDADRKEDIQAFPPTVVPNFQAGISGVNTVSQLTFSRRGAAPTAETCHPAVKLLSTLNATRTTKATADDPCKGPQGGTCILEQKLCVSKAVVLANLNAVMTTKATADDQSKGFQGGTCTFGADVRGYQYISVWVSQPPPSNTGGAAPAWPPPLRLSYTRAAGRRNSISTSVRAQIKAVPRLG